MTLNDVLPAVKEAIKLCTLVSSAEIINDDIPDVVVNIKCDKGGKLYYPVSTLEED